MYDCEKDGHITKVITWKYKKVKGDVKSTVSLYGCTKCDATSKNIFPGAGAYATVVTDCQPDCWCFKCKIKTLQLNAGDATRDIPDKKWRAKLDKYKKARENGIQPGGTSEAHVEAAYKASETLGKAYQAESMPKAHMINKRIAEVVNTGILNKE
jgi:hypothetical protein